MSPQKIEAIKNNRKLRVCAYARVSTDHEEQESSFENQASTYTRKIKSNPDYEFVDVYADQGVSGCSDKRPEFQRMIKDARAGKIDLIITKSVSRFARNTVMLLEYVRELKELGVAVYFEENDINSMTSEGEIMVSVLASFAQEELRSISENLKWTYRMKFERGEFHINTKRFLGYDKDERGHLIINVAEAKIVRRIFDMYLSGKGVHVIQNQLNKEKVPTITGSPWNSATILGILTNEKYMGDFLMQKTYMPKTGGSTLYNRGQLQQYYITDDHEAIISRDDWQYVQELLDYNRKKHGIEKDSTRYLKRYPNSGMLKCPYCGASLKRRKVYGGRIEWLCTTYINGGKESCQGIRIRDEELDGRIFTEPTVVEEVVIDGSKHYCYTCKADYDAGKRASDNMQEESSSILPRINRSRRTVIKL